jgi:nicotinamide-nucleotide adenylyltransferase
MKTALFIGRFQPLHIGHLKVIKWILKKYDKIIIVIGSSQESNSDKNPFSAKKRREMIDKTLKAENIEKYEIIEIPDVHDDEVWVKSILEKAKFDTVFTLNSWVKRCFERFNIRVKEHPQFGNISASGIRKRMREGKEWEHLVPKEVAKIVKRHEL